MSILSSPTSNPISPKKVALITGSATGVGAATALLLAQRGYNVVINYSKSEAEAKAAQTACAAAGADTLLLQGDVADDADCKALVAVTVEKWGRLDALVNNAGATSFAGVANWDAINPDMFNRILGVNTLGPFQMVRAAAPHLKAAGGCVVNVSSMAGVSGGGTSVPYIASKGALNALTLHLARAMAPDVRVNAVCPGFISSRWFVDGMGQAAFEKIKATVEQNAPLATASTPQDVADAIVWLVCGARTVTGELVYLDAGMHLGTRPALPPAAKP